MAYNFLEIPNPKSVSDFESAFDRGVLIEFRDMLIQGGMKENPKLRLPGEPRFIIYLRTDAHSYHFEDLKAANELDETKMTLLHELFHVWAWQGGYHQPKDEHGEDDLRFARQIGVWSKIFLDNGLFDELFRYFLVHPKCSIIFECAHTPFFAFWIEASGGHVCYKISAA